MPKDRKKSGVFDAMDFVEHHGTGSVDASYNLANRRSGRHVISFYQVPSHGEVSFKAFLTDFQDSYKSNWKRQQVYGKMDPISLFQNTERSINVSWDVVGGSPEEAMENLRRVGILTQMLYPGYNMGSRDRGTGFIDAAPVFKVKFLNLITDPVKSGGAGAARDSGLVCTIDGFTNSVDMKAGFVAIQDQLFPKVIRMSCVLHILHTNPVGFDATGQPRTPQAPYGQNIKQKVSDRALINASTNSTQVYTESTNTNLLTPSKRLRKAVDFNILKATGLEDAVD